MTHIDREDGDLEIPSKKGRGIFFIVPILILLVFVGVIAVGFAVSILNSPPNNFPADIAVSIETGESVKEITAQLQETSIVRSSSFLYFVIALFFESENIKASTYVFEKPLTSYEVAKQLTLGDFDSDLLRFTHIEGERASDIAKRAGSQLPNFDEATFLSLAEPLEGKLFPDTYFIPDTYTAEELVALMNDTFNNEINSLTEKINSQTLSLDEIVILASIIEREANTPESMGLVSSVLQNRIAIDMPLQADASIEYVLNKPLEELTPEDLKIDSPYNTYTNIGLPPTAIGNPGLTAINAVLEPTESDYYYYLTDDEGVFHYAKTYNEHLRNIELYLR